MLYIVEVKGAIPIEADSIDEARNAAMDKFARTCDVEWAGLEDAYRAIPMSEVTDND